MKELSQYIVHFEIAIREAFKQSTLNKGDFIIAVDNNGNILGLATDGDFRRAIWKEIPLENPVHTIINKKFIFFNEGSYKFDDIKQTFSSIDITQIPILKDGTLVDVIFRKDFYENKLNIAHGHLQLPVVIMAGGKGTRLDPFTRILPKPLIPIGDKPIIELIMDKFAEYGVKDFYISVKHKERMIRAFLEEFQDKYTITYINEDDYLGTAGALKYFEGKFEDSFIVSNCDVIIDSDYVRMSDYHKKGNYDLTIVSSVRHHIIPYGVCTLKDGELESMEEKPAYNFLVNTGLYILNPRVLPFIPSNQPFNMTDLIWALRKENRRIGVYPVSSESWTDIGQLEEYKKHLELIS